MDEIIQTINQALLSLGLIDFISIILVSCLTLFGFYDLDYKGKSTAILFLIAWAITAFIIKIQSKDNEAELQAELSAIKIHTQALLTGVNHFTEKGSDEIYLFFNKNKNTTRQQFNIKFSNVLKVYNIPQASADVEDLVKSNKSESSYSKRLVELEKGYSACKAANTGNENLVRAIRPQLEACISSLNQAKETGEQCWNKTVGATLSIQKAVLSNIVCPHISGDGHIEIGKQENDLFFPHPSADMPPRVKTIADIYSLIPDTFTWSGDMQIRRGSIKGKLIKTLRGNTEYRILSISTDNPNNIVSAEVQLLK